MKTMLNLALGRGSACMVWVVLLSALVLGGCGRSKECDQPNVTCADELQCLGGGVSGGEGQIGNTERSWIFSDNIGKIFGKDYKATLTVETLKGKSYHSYDAKNFAVGPNYEYVIAVTASVPPACSMRITLTLRDADLSRGTSVKDIGCYNAMCAEVNCATFTLDRKAVIYPVETATQAKDAAPHVRCEGFTYRRTNDLPDITWNVRSYFSYKFKDDPNVISYRFATGPYLGPAVTKPSDVKDLFDPDVTNPQLLVADSPYGLRLPMRTGINELAPASGTNDKVLRAGWSFGAYTVGCAMKQSVMADIVKTALNGASIGKNTLHIRFNDTDTAVPSGEGGWCSYFAPPGEEPAFQSYDNSKNNEKCLLL